MNQPTETNNEFLTFVSTLRDELMATSDGDVLEGTDLDHLRARRTRILEAAKKEAGRRRMAAARAKLQSSIGETASVEVIDPVEARRYIARAANDARYTLAARKLGEGLTDEEAIALYHQLRVLEREEPGEQS